jgi:hypothetical protein
MKNEKTDRQYNQYEFLISQLELLKNQCGKKRKL